MKKIIVLLYFRVYVDVLGFPVYFKQYVTHFAHKKRNENKYYFTNKSKVLFETQLIKQL